MKLQSWLLIEIKSVPRRHFHTFHPTHHHSTPHPSQRQSWLWQMAILLVIAVLSLGLSVWIVIRFVRFLLAIWGWLFVGGAVTLGIWLYLRQQHAQRSRQINTTFYNLIQKQQGRITSLDLAMATDLTGQAANEYLKAQAKAFSAQFEVTEAGDLIYSFPTAQSRTTPPDPSQPALTQNGMQVHGKHSNHKSSSHENLTQADSESTLLL